MITERFIHPRPGTLRDYLRSTLLALIGAI
jgi:hypothetical protein